MLSRDQRRRLAELRETFSIGTAPEPEAPPAEAPAPPAARPVLETPPPPAAAPEAAATDENLIEIKPEEAVETLLTEDEKKDEKAMSNLSGCSPSRPARRSRPPSPKMRSTRSFLIRDPNRLVSLAVLGSPKITEAEIEGIAGMKNVSDEVLRRIGNNRDWTKKYTVISSLVKNPRTPLPIAMGFVSRLQPRESRPWRWIAMSRRPSGKPAQRFVKAQTQKGTKE